METVHEWVVVRLNQLVREVADALESAGCLHETEFDLDEMVTA